MLRPKKMSAIVLVLLAMAIAHPSSTLASSEGTLSDEYREKLKQYAIATGRYFTSGKSNNLRAGFTHTCFGTGRFREKVAGNWIEKDLTRDKGSHVNINEVTLRFLALAAAYKMGWLTYFDNEDDRYNNSWGQIKRGLQTLRDMQNSENDNKFYKGHFHRFYWTCNSDQDREPGEIERDNNNIQSSDDNGLGFMNLCIVQGLAGDSTVTIPDDDRYQIITLCRQIRAAIDLKGFVRFIPVIPPYPAEPTYRGEIIHNFTNGGPSQEVWNRVSTEGAVILAALLLSGQISTQQFYEIRASLLNKPVLWQYQSGDFIPINKPSYHAALFMHGLRHVHGMPTTEEEFNGLNYFKTSLKPTLLAHLDFASRYAIPTGQILALGSQVMSQAFLDVPLPQKPDGEQYRFPGNEDNVPQEFGVSLAKATGPHAWFIPLARWQDLDQEVIKRLFEEMMYAYEPGFFHAVLDDNDTLLGWEAAIPWNPGDTTFTWQASDGTTKYTDMGRPYEALNAAYIVLSIFDALNQDRPLASYHVFNDRLKHIAAYFDNDTPLPQPIDPIPPLLLD